ncbi:uncharacterized protein QC761_0001540 [Podospora bellae-mahoneyi]|uniref:Uncharacterized protein n=1 Tax=Podospora bellae-mahoneyi TaxID=2093777 RepID=A0ABR0FU71_9PEZI|nr:hypothetical protein QC761_0001540 [Podospora bellae-mahoneyi]
MGYRIFHRPWRAKRPLYWGMVPELAGIIPLLVLFGVQQPDAWRTLFWRIGSDYKLNSSPTMILYAYANHRPLPTIPFVWSQTLTTFNVAITIVSLFILLAKMIAAIMKIFYPIIGTAVGVSLTALYAVSVYGQAGPDYADPRYPSWTPWYIRKSCDLAIPYNAVKSCQMSKGAFAVTVYMLAVYVIQTSFAIWAMWPNKMLDMMDDSDDEEEYGYNSAQKDKGVSVEMTTPVSPEEGESGGGGYYGHYQQQLQQQQQQQMSGAAGGSSSGGGFTHNPAPFTPRTQAFHTLDRKLPLRVDTYR